MTDKDLNSISRTNWAALEAGDDATIDYSDIPPLTDKFFENATLRIPAAQAKRLVSIEPDVLQWFEAHGGECGAAINSVLRRYIDGVEAGSGPSVL
jgi:uncharacterized protein (DUF4415 family)